MVVPAFVGFTLLGLGLGAIVPIALRAGGSRPASPRLRDRGRLDHGLRGHAGRAADHRHGSRCVGLRSALALVVALLVVLAVMARRVVSTPITLPEPAVPIDLA